MIPPRALTLWIARRFLSPAGLALAAAAALCALALPWAPRAPRGLGELAPDVVAGLARQGAWLCGLAALCAWFPARACACVRAWQRGEGDWLGTSSLSRGAVAWAHLAGAACALACLTLPFAVAAELRAGAAPRSRWLSDSAVESAVLLTQGSVARVRAQAPRGATRLAARFAVAAPGDGGPQATVRCTASRGGAEHTVRELRVSTSTLLELDLPPGSGPIELAIERVGPGAVVVLEGPRLAWLAAGSSRAEAELALAAHAWLAVLAATALALGAAAWASSGTALLFAYGVLALAALGDAPPAWCPGAGLRAALELASAGLGPRAPGLSECAGAALACAAGAGCVALQRELWRRAP